MKTKRHSSKQRQIACTASISRWGSYVVLVVLVLAHSGAQARGQVTLTSSAYSGHSGAQGTNDEGQLYWIESSTGPYAYATQGALTTGNYSNGAHILTTDYQGILAGEASSGSAFGANTISLMATASGTSTGWFHEFPIRVNGLASGDAAARITFTVDSPIQCTLGWSASAFGYFEGTRSDHAQSQASVGFGGGPGFTTSRTEFANVGNGMGIWNGTGYSSSYTFNSSLPTASFVLEPGNYGVLTVAGAAFYAHGNLATETGSRGDTNAATSFSVTFGAAAPGSTWIGGDGDWAAPAGWDVTPNGSGAVARFLQSSGARNVQLNGSATLGRLVFYSSGTVSLTGTGSLKLRGGEASDAANLLITDGQHIIDVPVQIESATTIGLGANSTIRLSELHGSSPLTKVGTGTLSLGSLNVQTFSVSNGNVVLSPQAQAARVTALHVAAAHPHDAEFLSVSASLDLESRSMIIDYTSGTPIGSLSDPTTVAGSIRVGYADGLWTGRGIATSLGGPNSGRAIGYAEATGVLTPGSQFLGWVVDQTSLLLRSTFYGDANLDGHVNFTDFAILTTNFGMSGMWSQGDFDYDGLVTIGDQALLSAYFNQSVPADLPRTPRVPEPATLTLLGLSTAFSLRRRRA